MKKPMGKQGGVTHHSEFLTDVKREELAALCHEQWSGWMHYLFSKCEPAEKGCVTIPKWAVDRWTRQMDVKYEDLSEEEKCSDRREADRFLNIL